MSAENYLREQVDRHNGAVGELGKLNGLGLGLNEEGDRLVFRIQHSRTMLGLELRDLDPFAVEPELLSEAKAIVA